MRKKFEINFRIQVFVLAVMISRGPIAFGQQSAPKPQNEVRDCNSFPSAANDPKMVTAFNLVMKDEKGSKMIGRLVDALKAIPDSGVTNPADVINIFKFCTNSEGNSCASGEKYVLDEKTDARYPGLAIRDITAYGDLKQLLSCVNPKMVESKDTTAPVLSEYLFHEMIHLLYLRHNIEIFARYSKGQNAEKDMRPFLNQIKNGYDFARYKLLRVGGEVHAGLAQTRFKKRLNPNWAPDGLTQKVSGPNPIAIVDILEYAVENPLKGEDSQSYRASLTKDYREFYLFLNNVLKVKKGIKERLDSVVKQHNPHSALKNQGLIESQKKLLTQLTEEVALIETALKTEDPKSKEENFSATNGVIQLLQDKIKALKPQREGALQPDDESRPTTTDAGVKG